MLWGQPQGIMEPVSQKSKPEPQTQLLAHKLLLEANCALEPNPVSPSHLGSSKKKVHPSMTTNVMAEVP